MRGRKSANGAFASRRDELQIVLLVQREKARQQFRIKEKPMEVRFSNLAVSNRDRPSGARHEYLSRLQRTDRVVSQDITRSTDDSCKKPPGEIGQPFRRRRQDNFMKRQVSW